MNVILISSLWWLSRSNLKLSHEIITLIPASNHCLFCHDQLLTFYQISSAAGKWILNLKPGFINLPKDKVSKIISTLEEERNQKKILISFSSPKSCSSKLFLITDGQIVAAVIKFIFQICRLWQKCTNISDCKFVLICKRTAKYVGETWQQFKSESNWKMQPRNVVLPPMQRWCRWQQFGQWRWQNYVTLVKLCWWAGGKSETCEPEKFLLHSNSERESEKFSTQSFDGPQKK